MKPTRKFMPAAIRHSYGLSKADFFIITAILIFFASPRWVYSQQTYNQTNLTSDITGFANNTDPNLKNPWGLVQGPTPFWVSDQATGVATLYDGNGVAKSLVVNVNAVTVPPPPNGPTGIVFNAGSGFLVGPASSAAKSLFLFADLNGTVYGWSPTINRTTAQAGVAVSGAVLTGLAINSTNTDIYAANFTPSGGIDEFNSSWSPVSTTFSDPSLPSGYAPYNVSDVNGTLLVAYEPICTSLTNCAFGRPVQGIGNGVIAQFNDSNGNFISNLITGGQLDDPWGMALAPADFGKFSNDLLVGNFGNGVINAYDPSSGNFLGTLQFSGGNAITNSGLWSLAFGNGTNNTNANTLYITAGINNQADGLMAAINPAPTPEPAAMLLFGTGLMAIGWIFHRRQKGDANRRSN